MFKIYDGRKEFYQWDLDRKLIVSDPIVNKVHFCNKTDDCSLVVEVYEEDGLRLANVPNILLQTDWPIKAYAYCGDCYTKESATFKVIARTRPADYIYTETIIYDIEKAVDKAVNEALTEAKESGDFDYILTEDDKQEIASIVGVSGTKGLEYGIATNGASAYCKGIGTATDTDIVIASEYSGLPVTYLAVDAFSDTNITSIFIPKTIERIQNRAFRNTPSLKKVVFEAETQYVAIKDMVFSNTAIDTIVLPGDIEFSGTVFSMNEVKNIVFKGLPTSITAYSIKKAENIYVPWGEGEVEGAPWGSTDATIHYNSPICEAVTMDGFVGVDYLGDIRSDVDALADRMLGAEDMINEFNRDIADLTNNIGDIDIVLDTVLGHFNEVIGYPIYITINDVNYQAVEGMRWCDWVGSVFDTDNVLEIVEFDNTTQLCFTDNGDGVIDTGDNYQYPHSIIQDGEAYFHD